VDALLAAPDRSTWSGRRDHAFILTAAQTGFRLSEMTGLKREDLVLGAGAHLRVIGKDGASVVRLWPKLPEPYSKPGCASRHAATAMSCFPTRVEVGSACTAFSTCSTSIVVPLPVLFRAQTKRVTVHRLRHYLASLTM